MNTVRSEEIAMTYPDLYKIICDLYDNFRFNINQTQQIFSYNNIVRQCYYYMIGVHFFAVKYSGNFKKSSKAIKKELINYFTDKNADITLFTDIYDINNLNEIKNKIIEIKSKYNMIKNE